MIAYFFTNTPPNEPEITFCAFVIAEHFEQSKNARSAYIIVERKMEDRIRQNADERWQFAEYHRKSNDGRLI